MHDAWLFVRLIRRAATSETPPGSILQDPECWLLLQSLFWPVGHTTTPRKLKKAYKKAMAARAIFGAYRMASLQFQHPRPTQPLVLLQLLHYILPISMTLPAPETSPAAGKG